MGELVIRLPLALRIFAILVAVCFAVVTIATWSQSVGGGAANAAFITLVTVLVGVSACRAPFLSLRASGQEIVVRNTLWTHHVPLWQVEGTDVGPSWIRGWVTVRLRVKGGRPVPVEALILRDRKKHQKQIEDWVAEARALQFGEGGGSYQIGDTAHGGEA